MKLHVGPEMRLKYERELATQYERTTPLEMQQIRGGYVFPLEISWTGEPENREYGGVCDDALNFVELSLTKRVSPPNFRCSFNDWYVGASPSFSRATCKYVDEDVIFLGPLHRHYGHFILESVARLWPLMDGRYADMKCVYISDEGEDRFIEFFDLFGLHADRRTRISEPTKFRSVIVPEQSIRLHDFYHLDYKRTIDRIAKTISPIPNQRVYFSKKARKNDRAIGEAAIERILSKNGFSIYYPELMSIHETLAVLQGCETFVATSGTNIHNSVFTKDGTDCICLNRSEHFHPIQIMIDRMKNLNVTYVDAYVWKAGENWSSGPFLLFPGKYLRNFYRQMGFEYHVTDLLRGLQYAMINYMTRRIRRILINVIYRRLKSWIRVGSFV